MATNTAAVSWLQNGVKIRVYSSDGTNIIERCWDGGGWYTGAYKSKGQTVSATAWYDGGPFLRVYSTDNGKTTEYCWDRNGPWYKGGYTG